MVVAGFEVDMFLRVLPGDVFDLRRIAGFRLSCEGFFRHGLQGRAFLLFYWQPVVSVAEPYLE